MTCFQLTETLRQHDVVVQEGERWRYAVELMRLWVVESLNG